VPHFTGAAPAATPAVATVSATPAPATNGETPTPDTNGDAVVEPVREASASD
jgi:hypothetical protein